MANYIRDRTDLEYLGNSQSNNNCNKMEKLHIIEEAQVDNFNFIAVSVPIEDQQYKNFHILIPPEAIWHYTPLNLKLCGRYISYKWGEKGVFTEYSDWISGEPNIGEYGQGYPVKGHFIRGPSILVEGYKIQGIFRSEIKNFKNQIELLKQGKITRKIEIKGLDTIIQEIKDLALQQSTLASNLNQVVKALHESNELLEEQINQKDFKVKETLKTQEKETIKEGRNTFMEALKKTAKAAKIASVRGAKVASSKQIADLMVVGTQKALGDTYPAWLKESDLGKQAEPFIISFLSHLAAEMYPDYVPKAKLVKAVASYAMEGTSNNAMEALFITLKPALANFADLAKKIPLENIQEELEEVPKFLEANGKQTTASDIEAEIETLNKLKEELKQREIVLLKKRTKDQDNS